MPALNLSISSTQSQHLLATIMKLVEADENDLKLRVDRFNKLMQKSSLPVSEINAKEILAAENQQKQNKLELEKLKILEMNFSLSEARIMLFQTRTATSSKEMLLVRFICVYVLMF